MGVGKGVICLAPSVSAATGPGGSVGGIALRAQRLNERVEGSLQRVGAGLPLDEGSRPSTCALFFLRTTSSLERCHAAHAARRQPANTPSASVSVAALPPWLGSTTRIRQPSAPRLSPQLRLDSTVKASSDWIVRPQSGSGPAAVPANQPGELEKLREKQSCFLCALAGASGRRRVLLARKVTWRGKRPGAGSVNEPATPTTTSSRRSSSTEELCTT